MVDPNRKINRLTDKDIEFLDECEDEFISRYTEQDEDFRQHCSKTLSDPPVVDNWGFGSGQQNNRMSGGHRHNYGSNRGGQGNNRGWHDKRNRNNYRRDRYNPYENRRERKDDNKETNRPPMNVRRDYGNFVPASKD